MFDKYLMDLEKIFTSINSPLGVFRISSAEDYHNQLQSMRSWCDENFESEEEVLFRLFIYHNTNPKLFVNKVPSAGLAKTYSIYRQHIQPTVNYIR